MKLKPADLMFSKCVREAADWTCARCGSQHVPGSRGLHCSHRFSRRHKSVRFCVDNVDPLCFSCHQWFGGNPLESAKWLEERVGTGMIELLTEKKNQVIKFTQHDWKEAAAHYREQYALLMDKRSEGIRGPLEFESWQ